MRRASKVDANHGEIIAAFRKLGCSVLDISQLKNCGDAVVATSYRTAIVEIKDGRKPPSARKLTAGEQKFRDEWKGLYCVIESVEDVINLVKAMENK